MTSSPRTRISPSSAILTSVFLSGGPTVSSLIPALGRLQLITRAASVWPSPWRDVACLLPRADVERALQQILGELPLLFDLLEDALAQHLEQARHDDHDRRP